MVSPDIRKGQADRVIEFVKSDSPLAEKANVEYAVIKETERKKLLPKQIIELMKTEGYSGFGMYQHTELWKKLDAKKSGKGYGTMVADKHWHWYDSWVEVVRKHCQRTWGVYSD